MLAAFVLIIVSSQDIQPIFADHCVQCHRAGGMAPFSVETFEQARPWAKSIARAVANKDMPPFGAGGPIGKWVDDPRLTEDEIAAVVAWTDAPKRYDRIAYTAPVAANFEHAVSFEVDVPGNGLDYSKVIQVENTLPAPIQVVAFHWSAEGPAPIHHASMQTRVRTGDKSERVRMPLSLFVPGHRGAVIPDGYAVTLHPDTRLLAPVHIGPKDEPSKVAVTVAFREGRGAELKALPEPIMLECDDGGFEIPARSIYRRDAVKVAVSDMQIHAVTVHMHALGQSARLVTDNGVTVIEVPRYNENWQLTYTLAEPLRLRGGTVLTAEFAWDNIEGAAPVEYGGESTQEMGWIEIIWTPTD